MATKSVTMNGAATRTKTITREVKGTLQSVNLTNQKLEVTDDLRAAHNLEVGPARTTSVSPEEALRLMDQLKQKTRVVTKQTAEMVEIPISLKMQGEVTHSIQGMAEVLEKTALEGEEQPAPQPEQAPVPA